MQIRLHLSLFIFWCDVSKWSNILMVTSLTPNIKVSAWPKFEHQKMEKMTCYTNACIENNSITFYNIKESRSAYISFFFCWTNASLITPHKKNSFCFLIHFIPWFSLSFVSVLHERLSNVETLCSLITSAMQASGLHLPPLPGLYLSQS